jgi:hypothetical protein
MPRKSLILQIFVASPSDVAEERLVLETVIAQANQAWSKNLGITFELLKWETNVRPSFSTDPQFAINEQIGEDYDVFIGIFWSRIGTPTPRSTSGSLEEFERAYARFRGNGSSPEIMLYFKQAAIPQSKLDGHQFQLLKEFKNSLAGKGGLYSEFEDLTGFESSVRAHLAAIAQKFATQYSEFPKNVLKPDEILLSTNEVEGARDVQSVKEAEDKEDSDYGYIDYIEIYEAHLGDMTSSMSVISEATVRVGEQIRARITEMLPALSAGTKSAKKFLSKTADNLNSYADNLSGQVYRLTASREAGFSALTNALALHGNFSNSGDQLPVLKRTLVSLVNGAQSAKASMQGMRESTSTLPPMSKELNISKRAVVSQLDALLLEIDSLTSTVSNIIEAIDRMLD